ncbi:MAG: hypothetical protein NTU67_03660 [Gemmatimonadetes bacterium]|jgi:hypothetical protein|nr:hypothetical protein [Gemmatimonadota bacterium]
MLFDQHETLEIDMMNSIRVALASAILAFGTFPAMAADFTFIVPVDVSNLPPEIVSFNVQCAVSTAATGGILQTAFTNLVVRNRAYRGDVTVEVTVIPSRRAEAAYYKCEIRDFRTATGGGLVYGLYGSQPLPRASGSPFRGETDLDFIPIPR